MPEYKAELKHVRRSYMDALESFRRHLAEFDQLWLFTFFKKNVIIEESIDFSWHLLLKAAKKYMCWIINDFLLDYI